jgi:transcriptional regulator with XRE-family HTH domain
MLSRDRIERQDRQMSHDEPTLAAVLQRLMRQERLRPHQVAAASGLTRAHLWLLLNGRIARPTPETIRKLAVGLATDPYDNVVDQDKRILLLRQLSAAAGYPDLSVQSQPGALVREIQAVVGNPQMTDFYERLIREHPSLSPTLQQLILALIQIHGQPGGEQVIGRLAEQSTLFGLLTRLRNGNDRPD